jgi:hypothetical protein
MAFGYNPGSPVGGEMILKRKYVLLLAFFVLASSFGGCRCLGEYFGGRTVDNPDDDSPEWVVQQVIAAALSADGAYKCQKFRGNKWNPKKGPDRKFNQAWKEFSQYLHSHERNSASLNTWKCMKFPALIKKVKCFVKDPEGPSYVVRETREISEDEIHLMVKCKTTEMPTPCKLYRDPKDDDEWRIRFACLN